MKNFLLFISAFTLLVGCGPKDMLDDIHVEINTSLPLGSLNFSDSTLFALAGDFSSSLVVDKNHVLGVRLDDSITLVDEKKFEMIFNMPVQDIQVYLTLPQLPIPDGTMTPIPENYGKLTSPINLPNGERVDSVVFSSGSVTVNLASAGDLSKVYVTIPEIISNITKLPLRLKPGQTAQIDRTYAFVPHHKADQSNIITLVFDGQVPYSSQIEVNAVVAFSGLRYAMGYFGRKEIKAPSVTIFTTNEFNEFASMIDYLYFDTPTIDFKIFNQYDAPMLLTIDTLDISGQQVLLREGYNRFFVGAKQVTNLSISNENTVNGKQLSQLINKNFKQFKVNINAIMNPTVAEVGSMSDGYVPPTYNKFSLRDSVFGTYAMGLPMNCVLQNLHFEQQIDLDMASVIGENSTVKQFAFAFTGKNYMPLDIAINAFVRENDTPDGAKTVLFEAPIVVPASATVNVFAATPWVIDGTNRQIVDIKSELLDKMTNSKRLFLELTVSTKNAAQRDIVKIFSPSAIELNVQIGTKLDFAIGNK